MSETNFNQMGEAFKDLVHREKAKNDPGYQHDNPSNEDELKRDLQVMGIGREKKAKDKASKAEKRSARRKNKDVSKELQTLEDHLVSAIGQVRKGENAKKKHEAEQPKPTHYPESEKRIPAVNPSTYIRNKLDHAHDLGLKPRDWLRLLTELRGLYSPHESEGRQKLATIDERYGKKEHEILSEIEKRLIDTTMTPPGLELPKADDVRGLLEVWNSKTASIGDKQYAGNLLLAHYERIKSSGPAEEQAQRAKQVEALREAVKKLSGNGKVENKTPEQKAKEINLAHKQDKGQRERKAIELHDRWKQANPEYRPTAQDETLGQAKTGYDIRKDYWSGDYPVRLKSEQAARQEMQARYRLTDEELKGTPEQIEQAVVRSIDELKVKAVRLGIQMADIDKLAKGGPRDQGFDILKQAVLKKEKTQPSLKAERTGSDLEDKIDADHSTRNAYNNLVEKDEVDLIAERARIKKTKREQKALQRQTQRAKPAEAETEPTVEADKLDVEGLNERQRSRLNAIMMDWEKAARQIYQEDNADIESSDLDKIIDGLHKSKRTKYVKAIKGVSA